MRLPYHRLITAQALASFFSPAALEIIIRANLAQDHWFHGQIGHPEYHFDESKFSAGLEYLEACRGLIRSSLHSGDAASALRAFGRLTHAAQDFYAHSNYVALWMERFPQDAWPSPGSIDPLDPALLEDSRLHSGIVILPLEAIRLVPGLSRLLDPLLPADFHARMNLDSPDRGPLFPYAFSAAIARTRLEYDRLIRDLPPASVLIFSRLTTAA